MAEKVKYILLALFTMFACRVHAQVDSAYIASFPQEVALGAFTKFNLVGLNYEAGDETLVSYAPNSPVGLGLSFAYKGFSFRGSYGFDFMRDPKLGKTKIIDFQTHYHGRKFILDLYVQDYKGMYAENDKAELTGIHPDIRLVQYGASWQYVFNHRRFSYRAAFNSSERQLQSAGSFQAGAGVYYNYVSSDTSLAAAGLSTLNSYRLSLLGGYAHTWVIKKNIQVLAGASVSVNLMAENFREMLTSNLQVRPGIQSRVAASYNGDTWTVGLSAAFNMVWLSRHDDVSMMLNVGNSKVFFIKRLDIEERWRKK